MQTASTDTVKLNDGNEEDYLVDEPVSPAGPDLFSAIMPGFHDGFIVDDLGGAIFSIREEYGIEAMVALANGGNAQCYFDWVQSKVGVDLTDWEPVQLTINQAWIGVSAGASPDGLAFSCRTWRANHQCDDALVIRQVEVFALRHRAWSLLRQNRVREFYVSMQRSHMEARWLRTNPGREMQPEDMKGDAGFVVYGRPRGSDSPVKLTFPVADIGEVIQLAKELKRKRVAKLSISEPRGVGFPFNKRTYPQWMRIAELDRRWGGNGNGRLLDLGHSAGMWSW